MNENHDEISEYAAQIAGVGDLLMRSHDVPQETIASCGWVIRELAERIGASLSSNSDSAITSRIRN